MNRRHFISLLLFGGFAGPMLLKADGKEKNGYKFIHAHRRNGMTFNPTFTMEVGEDPWSPLVDPPEFLLTDGKLWQKLP